MDLSKCNIGFGITGSFCTFEKVKDELMEIAEMGAEIYPVFSFHAMEYDTRFGMAKNHIEEIEDIACRKGIKTIMEAEPIGPLGYLDVMVIAPCTGNTLAKLVHGIIDTPVLMAAKAHLRNNKPLVISVSTNDAMGMNFKNIGELMNIKNIYFVPYGQDDYIKKPNSLISDVKLLPDTIEAALSGRQLQPVLITL